MPRPSPGDPRYYEEVHDEGDDVLQDMIRDNNEYAEDDYDAGDDEVPEQLQYERFFFVLPFSR